MWLLVSRRVALVVVVIAIAGVATTIAGQRYVVQSRHTVTFQDRIAVMQYIGKADGSNPFVFKRLPALTQRMKHIHHYPFDGRFHNDCGLFGERIDLRRARPIGDAGATGRVEEMKRDVLANGAVSIEAWVEPIDRVRCVLVAARNGRVVGTGVTGAATPVQARSSDRTLAGDAGISALAVDGYEGYELLVSFEGDDTFYRLPKAPSYERG